MDVLRDIVLTSDYDSLIDFIIHFWRRNRYSVYNCLLAYAQRPGAVMLATANQWRNNYNREIKHGVSPIVIIRPFGPVEFVYDYLDTYGEKELFPNRITASKNFDIQDWWATTLINSLKENGIYCSEANFGTRKGADICIVEKPITYSYINKKRKEIEVTTDCCITTNCMSDDKAKFLSTLHELAHLFCGHLIRGKNTPKNISFPNRTKERLTNNQMEFEAEIAASMVCEVLGVKHDSSKYLIGYMEENNTAPDINYTEMIKAVDKILHILPQEIIANVCHPESFAYQYTLPF